MLSRWVAIALVAIAMVACRTQPRVLSPYASELAVSLDPDGSSRRRARPHRGVDLGPLPVGEVILASAPGVVASVERSERFGGAVDIAHFEAGFVKTSYVHLEEVFVVPGATVRRGDPIGTVGLFRASGGIVHVHLELWCLRGRTCAVSGPLARTADPMTYMDGCFQASKAYPSKRLVLTYPFRC